VKTDTPIAHTLPDVVEAPQTRLLTKPLTLKDVEVNRVEAAAVPMLDVAPQEETVICPRAADDVEILVAFLPLVLERDQGPPATSGRLQHFRRPGSCSGADNLHRCTHVGRPQGALR